MIIWYAQEHRASCVAACVRIVLFSHNQFVTEKKIRQALGDPRFGLSLAQAYDRMARYRFDVTFHDDWGLIDLRDCLRDGWYPIVGVDRQFFGHKDSPHAIVLIEIGSQAIRALDPLGGSSPEIYSPETFGSAWSSAGQQALIVKAPFTL